MNILLAMSDRNGVEAVLTAEPVGDIVRLMFRVRAPNQPAREKDFGEEPKDGDGVIELIDGLRDTFTARGFTEVKASTTH